MFAARCLRTPPHTGARPQNAVLRLDGPTGRHPLSASGRVRVARPVRQHGVPGRLFHRRAGAGSSGAEPGGGGRSAATSAGHAGEAGRSHRLRHRLQPPLDAPAPARMASTFFSFSLSMHSHTHIIIISRRSPFDSVEMFSFGTGLVGLPAFTFACTSGRLRKKRQHLPV